METKTKITFDKKEIDVLLSVIDMLEFQDWMDGWMDAATMTKSVS